MRTYTIILTFREGVYVSQLKAEDVKSVIYLWAKSIDISEVKYMGQSSKNELIKLMSEEEPALLNGMENIWCISGILRTGFFLGYVVSSGS
jgi:hypothetical protein